jgi:hypothetical protein
MMAFTRFLQRGGAAAGAALLLGCATSALASSFDGSRDLLCAPTDVAECDTSARCERVSPSEVDLPHFLRVEFRSKRLVSVATPERATAIENVRSAGGLTLLQGAENGRAWSIAIDQETGAMSGSVLDAQGAFAVFGACTVP